MTVVKCNRPMLEGVETEVWTMKICIKHVAEFFCVGNWCMALVTSNELTVVKAEDDLCTWTFCCFRYIRITYNITIRVQKYDRDNNVIMFVKSKQRRLSPQKWRNKFHSFLPIPFPSSFQFSFLPFLVHLPLYCVNTWKSNKRALWGSERVRVRFWCIISKLCGLHSEHHLLQNCPWIYDTFVRNCTEVVILVYTLSC